MSKDEKFWWDYSILAVAMLALCSQLSPVWASVFWTLVTGVILFAIRQNR